VVTKTFVPDAGDLVWLDFDPQTGREQAGRRPALVLSPAAYNRAAGLVVACPVTSRVKGYPFEVRLPPGVGIEGVVLADHLKSADWRQRNARKIGRAPDAVLADVRIRVAALLGM
jgi:mRNA interferase MazF